MVGKALFLGLNADFEGYIIDKGKAKHVVALGIVIMNVAMNNFAQRMFDESARSGQILDASWMTNTTASK